MKEKLSQKQFETRAEIGNFVYTDREEEFLSLG
jgi:hypothetical protein